MKCIINFHPLQKYPKIGIFGIRINHLATLVRKSIVADHVMTVHIQFNFCCQKVTYSRMPCHAMSSRVVPYFHLHTWWAVITLAAKLTYIHTYIHTYVGHIRKRVIHFFDIVAYVRTFDEGCQMVYFHTKSFNLGIFRRALEWNILVYFISIWNILRPFWYILWPFGIYFGHLVYFYRFGLL
jgi:hypothetical protein